VAVQKAGQERGTTAGGALKGRRIRVARVAFSPQRISVPQAWRRQLVLQTG
jgi:hypothetical protein